MDFTELYRPRDLIVDVCFLAAIAAGLVAIHYLLPPSLQRQLAFHHGAFNAYGLLTSAYVHVDGAHLRGNLVGFAMTSLYAYLLCLRAGRRRWFHATAAALLFALPVAVNLLTYGLVAVRYPTASPVSRGFSGVVAGFAGFLLVALAAFLRERYDRDLAASVCASLLLLFLLEVDIIYARTLRPVPVGLVLLGIAATLGRYAVRRGGSRRTKRTDRDRRDAKDALASVLVVAMALSYLGFGLFPTEIVVDGRFRNVFAHAVGMVGGIGLSVGLAGCVRR